MYSSSSEESSFLEPHLPLVGMAKEKQRLIRAFNNREPIMVMGCPGSGKTRLIKESLASNKSVLFIGWQQPLHALLVALARALIATHHADFLRRAKLSTDRNAWLANQTSIHLKGLLWSALENLPVPIVLDGISGSSLPTYRFLQRIYYTPGMALFGASRDSSSLGALGRLFWHPANLLKLPPLREPEAGRLFEEAAGHFGLRDLNLNEFRKKVLASARGNPGQIIEMCRLAAEPKYVSGRYVKFSLLRIDAMTKFAV